MKDEIPHAQPPPAPLTTRLWRWRRNPLRRRTDQVQAWIALTLTTVVLATAPMAMVVTGHTVDRSLRLRADDQARTRHRTTAELLHDAPQHPEPGSDEAEHVRYPAEVRFADADGRTRTAQAEVPPGLPAGGTVQVWVTDGGDLTDPPMDDGEIRSRTVGWAATAGIAVAVAGAAVYASVGYTMRRRSLAEWDRAWAEVAPHWTAST